jgi:hypothetical protein
MLQYHQDKFNSHKENAGFCKILQRWRWRYRTFYTKMQITNDVHVCLYLNSQYNLVLSLCSSKHKFCEARSMAFKSLWLFVIMVYTFLDVQSNIACRSWFFSSSSSAPPPLYLPLSFWIVLVKNQKLDIQKAEVKLKLVTDTYMLQYHQDKFCHKENAGFCKICKDGVEDIEHFILKCKPLDEVRQNKLEQFKRTVDDIRDTTIRKSSFSDLIKASS